MEEQSGESAERVAYRAAWTAVLDQIEQSLTGSLNANPELEAQPLPADGPSPLTRLEERLGAWQAHMETAERQAAAADRQLESEQTALAEWITKLSQVRQSFSTWLESGTPKMFR